MKIKSHLLVSVILTILGVSLAACATQGRDEIISTSVPATEYPDTDAPTPVWPALLQVTPLPFASPLPSSDSTALDGIYVKYDPNPPQWWLCLRWRNLAYTVCSRGHAYLL